MRTRLRWRTGQEERVADLLRPIHLLGEPRRARELALPQQREIMELRVLLIRFTCPDHRADHSESHIVVEQWLELKPSFDRSFLVEGLQ